MFLNITLDANMLNKWTLIINNNNECWRQKNGKKLIRRTSFNEDKIFTNFCIRIIIMTIDYRYFINFLYIDNIGRKNIGING